MARSIKTKHWYLKLYTGGTHKPAISTGTQTGGWYVNVNCVIFAILAIHS